MRKTANCQGEMFFVAFMAAGRVAEAILLRDRASWSARQRRGLSRRVGFQIRGVAGLSLQIRIERSIPKAGAAIWGRQRARRRTRCDDCRGPRGVSRVRDRKSVV